MQDFDSKQQLLAAHALLQLLGISAESPTAMHAHKCPRCGLRWEHQNSCAGDEHAHTCASCGTPVWNRHYGD